MPLVLRKVRQVAKVERALARQFDLDRPPTILLSEFFPRPPDEVDWFSVFLAESDQAPDVAMALNMASASGVARALFLYVSAGELEEAGITLRKSDGKTGFPEIDALHRDLMVPTAAELNRVSRLFLGSEPLIVELPAQRGSLHRQITEGHLNLRDVAAARSRQPYRGLSDSALNLIAQGHLAVVPSPPA